MKFTKNLPSFGLIEFKIKAKEILSLEDIVDIISVQVGKVTQY